MKITPENTILLHSVNVHVIEAILNTLREHGSVYVEVSQYPTAPVKFEDVVPTLAEVLYGR